VGGKTGCFQVGGGSCRHCQLYGSPGPIQAARLAVVYSLALHRGGPMDEEVVLLYLRALDLLSRGSVYVPQDVKDEIVKLAKDGKRAGIPVQVERAGGLVMIDPWRTLDPKSVGHPRPHPGQADA